MLGQGPSQCARQHVRTGVPPGIDDESNVLGVHESETDVVEADEHHVVIDAADDHVE